MLECAIVALQSLRALFRLLTTGGTLTYCPQAATFAKALGTAARHVTVDKTVGFAVTGQGPVARQVHPTGM